MGPPRPRRPLAFAQPCPMGVTPLYRSTTMNFNPVSAVIPLQCHSLILRRISLQYRNECMRNNIHRPDWLQLAVFSLNAWKCSPALNRLYSGIARHFLTVRTYDFWRHNSKIKHNTSLFQVMYFDQRITYTLVESKQNSTVIEGIKVM